jgi:chromosome segregation ATPase
VCIVAGALFATTLGRLVDDQVRTRQQFDRAHTALRETRHQTGTVSGQLAELSRALAVLDTQVGSDTTALNQDASQLQGARTALATSQAHVSQQASLINSLQTCLDGVEQALNALSVGNQPSAIAALNSVSSSCSAASASSG